MILVRGLTLPLLVGTYPEVGSIPTSDAKDLMDQGAVENLLFYLERTCLNLPKIF